MILINLLPHREAARKRRKEAFQVTMFLAVVVGLLVAALVYWWFQSRIENQQDRNAYLSSQITVLDKQIKEIAGLEGEINALRERQKAVEAKSGAVWSATYARRQQPSSLGCRVAEESVASEWGRSGRGFSFFPLHV